LVYYLRRILHDWSDGLAAKVLLQLAAAVADDNRVLLSEQVLTNLPTRMNAMMDIAMMSISEKERSEEEFMAVAEMAGLRMMKVYRRKGSDVGVMKLVKA